MTCSLKFPTMLISSSGEKHRGSVLPIVEVAGVDAGPAPDEALAGQALVWPRPPAAITGAQLIAHHPISSCTERGAVSHAHSLPNPRGNILSASRHAQKCNQTAPVSQEKDREKKAWNHYHATTQIHKALSWNILHNLGLLLSEKTEWGKDLREWCKEDQNQRRASKQSSSLRGGVRNDIIKASKILNGMEEVSKHENNCSLLLPSPSWAFKETAIQ